MAKRRLEPILAEIIQALDGIAAATSGKTIEDFVPTGCSGTASSAASKSYRKPPGICRTIFSARLLVRGIGNILRHEYHKISDPIVWAVVIDSLPPLRLAVERMRNSVGEHRE